MAGTLVISTLSDGTNSTSSTNCIQGSAKAWVNFNGNSGSVAVRAGYNVSSITYRGTGKYTVNFTTAMVDANYCVTVACSPASPTSEDNRETVISNLTASSFWFATSDSGDNSWNDSGVACCSIFR